MADPKRLLDDPSSSPELQRLMRALPVPMAPTPEKLAELTRGLSSVTPISATKPPRAPARIAKYAGLAGLAGLGLFVAVHVGRAPKPTPAPQPSVAQLGAQRAAEPTAITPVAEPAVPSVSSAEPPVRPRSSGSSVRPAPAVLDTLAQEEALLEKARLAVAQSPASAIALLDEHQRRFPNGQLSAERMYLKVEALNRLGERAGAKGVAQALIRRFPHSVYARQVASLHAP